MGGEVEKIPILRLTEGGRNNIEDMVTREFPLTIILNDQELVTLLCSPKNLEYLAVGFLSSEGFLKSKDEIKGITADNERGVVRLKTEGNKKFAQDVLFKRIISSGCGKGASFYSATDATSQKVESKMEILTDEVFGECILKDIPTDDRMIITSGRISSEILHKVAKRNIPIIISISVPTNLGVRIADNLGITLISSVRGKRMNVCTNYWRVVTDGK